MNLIPHLTTILLICTASLSALCFPALSESTFYAVSNTSPALLYANDAQSGNWTVIGETGTTNLKALAFNNETNTLYGIDEGVLGTIDLETGAFNAYGTINLGTGFFGEIILKDIEALTYDPFSKSLFATHRIAGQGEGTNDVFFKIDPLTGLIVKDAVFDYKERSFDYVPISEILREGSSVKDIVGLAINPQNFDLIALHHQNGYSSISKLHKRTGEIEEILYNSYKPFSDIAFDKAGNLFATIGDSETEESSILMHINTEVGAESLVSTMSDTNLNFQSLTSTGVNMQALDNDLALRLNLSEDYENPLTQGSIVSFDITVFNQGELTVDEVRLSVEVDENNFEALDLGLYENNWIQFNRRIYGSFEHTIKPGESFVASFRIQLNDNFKGSMVLNSEIQNAYNHNITNELGKLQPLLDIDSNYDNITNEINVVNDKIDGGGIAANEDEDDHDIVMIEVERANNLILSPCYTVSSQENMPNVLFEFNPETGKWTEVGVTGGLSIKAIATDPINNLIYAVDGGTFGIINTNTAAFTPYRAIGTGDGVYGSILMDNIKGLTYDPINEIMYAVHRISGEGPDTNDVLFQIDVSTGSLIPVAMQDYDTGSPVDYVIIPEVYPPTDIEDFYDVDDIAYNPYTGELFAIQNQEGVGGANITSISKVNGGVEQVVFGMEDENDLEGLGFTSLGELYATQGDMGLTDNENNNFLKIDLANAFITILGKIDPDDGKAPAENADFEAFDCFTSYNDLALKMEVEPFIQQPLAPGSPVTFNISVFNQGKFANTDISIINYIPAGLVLNDANWTDLGNETALYTYNKLVEPGTSFQVPISFTVDANFEEESITNTAEILSSFNPQVADEYGNPMRMPDWDSFPDDQNNEINVTDNDINGGGPNAGKDEDDHDIAVVEVEKDEEIVTPLPYNKLTKFNCYAVSENNVSEDNAAPNVLFEFDVFTGEWTEVGITGGTSIEAIATDPINGIIYAADAGQFGTIDAKTAVFTPIGTGVGTALKGPYGNLKLDDIDGLTYDPVNEIMYAVHRIRGNGSGTEDILFQIDVSTGSLVPNAMIDPSIGNAVDYTIIPAIINGTLKNGNAADLYDVDDIAYNPYTGQLFAIQNQDGPGAISELNPLTGGIEQIVLDLDYDWNTDDLEGIGFNSLGQLYGTTGNNGACYPGDPSDETCLNTLVYLDLADATTKTIGKIDPDGEQKDFEAFDCFTAYNDLALKIAVDENTEQPALTGQAVDFEITIYNQGDFESSDIMLTNYIPDGLNLNDALWTDVGNGKATFTLNETLVPGATATAYISFNVAEGFEGQTLTNSVEISASFSQNINEIYGFPMPLPDLDSFPDDQNDEKYVTDNNINGGGPNAMNNEDEDDHDIAVLEIGEGIFTPTPYNKLTKFNCYAVSEDNAAPNVLFEFDTFTSEWTEVGITGGTSIEAIATDPINGVIYAADAGQFGTIDAKTAVFTPIGTGVGTALKGPYGNLKLDDIDGLTYDPVNEIMYAVHRIRGNGSGTEDILFQIDVSTGSLVPNAMIDPTGNAIDYAIIPAIFDRTFKKGNNSFHYDVDDIAYNPYTGELFAIQNQDSSDGAITALNPLTGEVEAIVFDLNLKDLEGIGFNSLGELYGTIGNNAICTPNDLEDETCLNILAHIDLYNGITENFGKIDPDGEQKDFEAFDCFTAYNDLALKIAVDENTEQPALTGQTVDFEITIYNQGDFESSDIMLTNYIPDGLNLNDALWTDVGNGKATFTLNETLVPGATATVYISFNVADGFEEQTLTNSVEISASFSQNINEIYGFPMPLSDLDSYPDDQNDEKYVTDNNINGGGPNAINNEDEDDHDIALLRIASAPTEACLIEFNRTANLPNISARQNWNTDLILTDFPCYAVSSGNASNSLFEYNPSTDSWTDVGATGANEIEAIATDPITKTIYAANAGTFGVINANTGLFTPIGDIGSGNGDYGLINLNNVHGLTYDPINQIMYASHIITDNELDENDLLFQIDVATGQAVSRAMLNNENKPVDYTIIPEVFNITAEVIPNYDVSDIAYNTYTGQLFGIHEANSTIISSLDAVNGKVKQIIFNTNNSNVGAGFSYLGGLFGTTSDFTSFVHDDNNAFIGLDLAGGYQFSISDIDLTNQQINFGAFDCFTAYNDLALKMEVHPNNQQTANIGENVSFLVTIYNQGNFSNSDITIANYIPSGLCLVDENWGNLGNGTAFYRLAETLEPGDSTTLSINYTVNQNFSGQTITNAAEILASFNENVNQIGGTLLPLPDLDSNPDEFNNEIYVTDNNINGGGPNAINNEDEDDHDIAVLQIASATTEACLIEFNETADLPYISAHPNKNNSLILTDFPCYAVSSGNASNSLFEYNPSSDSWTDVGATGANEIEAIATDPITKTIYAANAGTFGVINANTGLFTPIGDIGSGNGDYGLINLNDIHGLTFDPVNQIMYASHRVVGNEPGTNDLLFQIDVATGQAVSGAMLNNENKPVDYAIIPEVFDASFASDIYDVSDIAYNTYTGQLFAIHHDIITAKISILDAVTGKIEQIIFKTDYIIGAGFSYLGGLFGTSSDFTSFANDNNNAFIELDLSYGRQFYLSDIDPSNQQVNFGAFDCFTAYNDLALKMEVDPNNQQSANIGETVSFLITIYNQGDFSNSAITITNYIPNGLCLVDNNWGNLGDGKAFYTLSETLEPGDSTTISINYTVNQNFSGQTITNAAEILASFNQNVNDLIGYSASLPDLDSYADAENNELFVNDNDINGGGPNAINNEDEDDHDIAVLQINNLPANITINPELCNALGSVQVKVELNVAPPFSYQLRDDNGYIIAEQTSANTQYQIPDLSSGTYTLVISDALNRTSTFEVLVPSLSELDGNSTCDNECPNYLIAPEGELSGTFKAKEVVEIKGYIGKTKTAVFDICK